MWITLAIVFDFSGDGNPIQNKIAYIYCSTYIQIITQNKTNQRIDLKALVFDKRAP